MSKFEGRAISILVLAVLSHCYCWHWIPVVEPRVGKRRQREEKINKRKADVEEENIEREKEKN